MIGTSLGPYKIIEQLGAGGMGEVYRARDTKLDRDVAIKVLPEELSADPDRLARLERETHLLAALNHANIAASLLRRSSLNRRRLLPCSSRSTRFSSFRY